MVAASKIASLSVGHFSKITLDSELKHKEGNLKRILPEPPRPDSSFTTLTGYILERALEPLSLCDHIMQLREISGVTAARASHLLKEGVRQMHRLVSAHDRDIDTWVDSLGVTQDLFDKIDAAEIEPAFRQGLRQALQSATRFIQHRQSTLLQSSAVSGGIPPDQIMWACKSGAAALVDAHSGWLKALEAKAAAEAKAKADVSPDEDPSGPALAVSVS